MYAKFCIQGVQHQQSEHGSSAAITKHWYDTTIVYDPWLAPPSTAQQESHDAMVNGTTVDLANKGELSK